MTFSRRLQHCFLLLCCLAWGPVWAEPHVLFQTSIINALLQGVYDGSTTVATLRSRGDFGLGTVNGLDGELLAVDGVFYQVRSDASIHRLAEEDRTPFASVMHFVPERREILGYVASMGDFEALVKEWVGSENQAVGVRVRGRFKHLTVRSVPRQFPPYRPLAEVVKEQSVWEIGEVTGTLVGFLTPKFFQAFNVPGIHLHFISDDRSQGGHVLDLSLLAGASLELDLVRQFVVDLPQSESFARAAVGQDLSRELHQVERQRVPQEAAGH